MVSRWQEHFLTRKSTAMSNTSSSAVVPARNHWNSTAQDILQTVNELRQDQLLIDIHIEASYGIILGAHKIVLAAHFPGLRSLLTQPSEANRSTISLTRYSEKVVEAVLDYAYTGDVELTVESAERIYLLAHNLQCKRLMAKCIRHLTQYLSVDNVVGVWGVAQSTNSTTLITACLPLLPTDIPRILQMRLTVDQLKMLFQLPWIKGLGAECQLRLVASWIDAEQSSTNRVEPIDQLDILLPEVDMPSMAEACFLYFMSENHVVITNQQCRQRLISARKEARQVVHEPDARIIEVKRGDAILRSATDRHPSGSLRLPIPFQDGCDYSFSNGKLYVTGGVINKDKSTNRSEVIDVANHPGMIIALPPMQTARRGHASAAAGSLVFVFGGWTGLFESTSSCEFYDSRTNRWTVLPNMCKESNCQSALFIGTGDDDAAVLVVGGRGGSGKEAAILTSRPHRGAVGQANQPNSWKWRKLSPMQRRRPCFPGTLLIGGERVLIVGGLLDRLRRTAEILQLPRDADDRGVWTLLTHQMTQKFGRAYLVTFNDRILAVGSGKQCEELTTTSASTLHNAPTETFVWKPLPKVQADGGIYACFTT